MRSSDWSSDVCSSDLLNAALARLEIEQQRLEEALAAIAAGKAELEDAYASIDADKEKIEAQLAELAILKSLRDDLVKKLQESEGALEGERQEIGRASCRERVCQYV